MVIEFRVENYLSIRNGQVLTLEAANIGDEEDPCPRKAADHDNKLLSVAALYGANASGKSTVLAALAFMTRVVTDSHPSGNQKAGSATTVYLEYPGSRAG
ncbi:MAG: ATP/GTP-binding protein [Gemmataceae bacterium]